MPHPFALFLAISSSKVEPIARFCSLTAPLDRGKIPRLRVVGRIGSPLPSYSPATTQIGVSCRAQSFLATLRHWRQICFGEMK